MREITLQTWIWRRKEKEKNRLSNKNKYLTYLSNEWTTVLYNIANNIIQFKYDVKRFYYNYRNIVV